MAAYKTGNYEPGVIIGHEFSGVVEDVGRAVASVARGDRVVGNGVLACGNCGYCEIGRPSLCDNLEMTGVTIDGAFADYIRLPEKVVYRMPKNLTFRQATMVDPLANVLRGVSLSSLKLGDSVLIQGAGPIGLLTLQAVRNVGASEVWVTEINPARRKVAKRLGADEAIDPTDTSLEVFLEKRAGEGPDLVFDCTGVPQTLAADPTLVRKAGEIVVLGICEEPVEADFFTVVLNELTIKGSYCGYDEYPLALQALSESRIDADSLISSVIPLEDIVDEGFKPLSRGSDDVKVVVEVSS